MISSTQSTTTPAAALAATMNSKSTTTNSSAAVSSQDRFLKLLVTQMQNQDPLNPMDNAQVTSQMAQLSTVTGIDKLNVTLQALSDSMLSNQSLQSTSMIGHGVLVSGSGIDLSSGSAMGGFQTTAAASSAQVSIYDQAGGLVRTVNLGAAPAGINKFQWDGKDSKGAAAADGTYTFSVNTVQGGSNVAATALQYGMVNSVNQSTTGATMEVGSKSGVTLSQVVQIL